jgi:hypothetical protein
MITLSRLEAENRYKFGLLRQDRCKILSVSIKTSKRDKLKTKDVGCV